MAKADTPATAPDATPAAPAHKPSAVPDKHHGQGGMFTRVGGKRVLQERTKTAEEDQAEKSKA